jgi:hypothetical protein
MDHFYQSIGEDWFSYPFLYKRMVDNATMTARFVEVGVWKGRSVAFMGVEIINSGKNITLDCVDTFAGSSEHIDPSHPFFNKQLLDDPQWLYNEFVRNTQPVASVINPIKAVSWEAAQLYDDNSLDFVFLDAAHDYDSVVKDINAWLPKVGVGCHLAGHDYNETGWPDLVKAINDYFGVGNFEVSEGCWIFKKK